MFILMLNDMRDAHVENLTPVCKAETVEELEAFIKREKVEGYRDPKRGDGDTESPGSWWGKTFRKGGPLEWRNDDTWWPDRRCFLEVLGVLTREELATVDNIPTIEELCR